MKSRRIINEKQVNQELRGGGYLSKQNADCLKGIFAICVLVHHLYQHSGLFHNTIWGQCLQILGSFSVAIFFFLSGFGLQVSYMKNTTEYINKFPLRKLLPFYVICVVLILAYSLLDIILGNPFSLEIFLFSFLFGKTIIGNGWYLQVQLLLYIFFWLIYKLIKNNKAKIFVIAIFVLVYSVMMYLLNFSLLWYSTVFAFLFGILWAQFKNHIDAFFAVTKNWWITFVSGFILFCCAVCISFVNYAVGVILSSNIFVILIIILIMKIRINFWITRMLAKISLGIYVVQGFFILGFHSRIVNIINPYLYCLAVTACTIILAICIQPLFELIYSIFNKIGKNRREQNNNIIN